MENVNFNDINQNKHDIYDRYVEETRKEYEASQKYFENRACPYYPCHKMNDEKSGEVHLNCLFCFCPLYHMENCPGNPSYKEKNGRRIKVCTNCTFPHVKEHYDLIMKIIRENSSGDGV